MANEKNFDLMKNITKSASMTEATVIKEKAKVTRAKKPIKADKKVTVNLTDEEMQKLEQLCEVKMMSKSQLIKIALYEAKIL